MERVVRLDRELNESKKAAVHKVRMLPKVLSVRSQRSFSTVVRVYNFCVDSLLDKRSNAEYMSTDVILLTSEELRSRVVPAGDCRSSMSRLRI